MISPRQRVNPQLRTYLVEPEGAAVISGKPVTNPKHKIQGGGYALTEPPLLDRDVIDEFLTVSDDDATAAARALAEEEGVFGGFSAGANLAAAIALLQVESGRVISWHLMSPRVVSVPCRARPCGVVMYSGVVCPVCVVSRCASGVVLCL